MAAITITDLTPGTVPLPSIRPQKGLRGAFMNIPYVGPARIDTGDHAEGIETGNGGGGGLPGAAADGYRQSDTFGVQDALGSGEIEDVGLSAADGAGVNVVTRPARFRGPAGIGSSTSPTAFTGDGVKGGSTPGAPIDTTGRAVSTGEDRFGRTKGVANAGAGLGTYDYTNFDGAGTVSGSGSGLGDAVKTISTGDNQPDSVEGDTVAVDAKVVGGPRIAPGPAGGASTTTPTLAAPLIGSVGDGTIGVVDGGGAIDVDLHANDITGGSNDRAGAVVAVYERDADDTDEDGPLVKFASIDGGTDATELVTVAAGTYRVYARWRAPRPAADGGGYVYGPIAIGSITVA